MTKIVIHVTGAVSRRLMPVLSVFAMLACGCARSGDQAEASYAQKTSLSKFEKSANRPPTAKTLYALSKIMISQGRDAEAAAVLRRIVREYPEFMPAYCDYSEVQVRNQRVDEAIEMVQAGLRIAPHDPVLLNDLGMCWMLQGNYADALTQFTRAAAVVPQDARYRANMAASLGMLGRYEESFALFNQVVPTPDARHNVSVLCEARLGSKSRGGESNSVWISPLLSEETRNEELK